MHCTLAVFNVNVNVEFKVTLHEQVLTVLEVTVCHTAGHYGEELR